MATATESSKKILVLENKIKSLEDNNKNIKDSIVFIMNRLFTCGQLYQDHVEIVKENLKSGKSISLLEQEKQKNNIGRRGL